MEYEYGNTLLRSNWCCPSGQSDPSQARAHSSQQTVNQTSNQSTLIGSSPADEGINEHDWQTVYSRKKSRRAKEDQRDKRSILIWGLPASTPVYESMNKLKNAGVDEKVFRRLRTTERKGVKGKAQWVNMEFDSQRSRDEVFSTLREATRHLKARCTHGKTFQERESRRQVRIGKSGGQARTHQAERLVTLAHGNYWFPLDDVKHVDNEDEDEKENDDVEMTGEHKDIIQESKLPANTEGQVEVEEEDMEMHTANSGLVDVIDLRECEMVSPKRHRKRKRGETSGKEEESKRPQKRVRTMRQASITSMWFQKPQPVRPEGERKMEESKVEAIEVPENHLSIGTWNACGLTKQKEVEILKSGLDIIGITETGKGREKDPPGYVWFGDNGQRTQRGRRTHGGAGFYVKQHLASLCDVVKEEPNRLWIRMLGTAGCKHVYFGSIYIKPAQNEEEMREELNGLARQVKRFREKGDVILMGDFNARVGRAENANEEAYIGRYGEETRNTMGRQLLQFLREQDMLIINNRKQPTAYTYQSYRNTTSSQQRQVNNSIVDYIITTFDFAHKVTNFQVGITGCNGLSDHKPITATIAGLQRKSKPRRIKYRRWRTDLLNPTEHPETCEKYKSTLDSHVEESWTPEFEDLAVECKTEQDAADIVDKLWKKMRELIARTATATLGRSKVTRKQQGDSFYWDNDLRETAQRREEAFKMFEESPSEDNWETYLKARKDHKQQFNVKQREFWKRFAELISNDFHGNKKLFWSVMSQKRRVKKTAFPEVMKTADGSFTARRKERLKVWEQYYASLLQDSDETSEATRFLYQLDVGNRNAEGMPSSLDQPITMAELTTALTLLKNKKAPEVDKLAGELLKHSGGGFQSALQGLFNFCLEWGVVPKEWGMAQIVPIFKSKDPKDPSNYRGISLLPIAGKLFFNILARRILSFAENTQAIVEEQGGFRSKRGCVHQIFTLSQVLKKRKGNGNSTYLFFVDLKKAFDSVDHIKLLETLRRKGMGRKLWKVIQYTYWHLRAQVLIQGDRTEWFPVTKGVRQGCPLSPILFSIFINVVAERLKTEGIGVPFGMPSNVENPMKLLSILMYADDIVLLTRGPEELQRAIDVVAAVCKEIGMEINTEKSQIMIVHGNSKARGTPTRPFLLPTDNGQVPLTVVDKYKYLGVWFNDEVTWDTHAQETLEKARKAATRVERLVKGEKIAMKAKLTAYSAIVRPIIEYAWEVWEPPHPLRVKLEGLQNKMLRSILGCARSTPAWALRTQLGVQRLETRRIKSRLHWAAKLICMDEGNMVRSTMKARSQLGLKRGRPMKTWWESTHHWIQQLELGPALQSLEQASIAMKREPTELTRKTLTRCWNTWKKTVELKLRALEKTDFEKDAQQSTKLRFLRRMNHDMTRLASYLNKPEGLSPIDRLRFKLLSGTSPLGVERARWGSGDGFCPTCDLGEYETEEHFLIDCPAYRDERQELYDQLDQAAKQELPFLVGQGNLPATEAAARLLQVCSAANLQHPPSSSSSSTEGDTREPPLHRFLGRIWEKRKGILYGAQGRGQNLPQASPFLFGGQGGVYGISAMTSH